MHVNIHTFVPQIYNAFVLDTYLQRRLNLIVDVYGLIDFFNGQIFYSFSMALCSLLHSNYMASALEHKTQLDPD